MSAVDEEQEKLRERLRQMMASPITPFTNTVQQIYPEGGMQTAVLKAEIATLRQQCAHLQEANRNLRVRVRELGLRYQDLLRRPQHAKTPEWLKRNLRFLIFACHPDRNAGKEEAQEVTKELLKLR